MNNIPKNICDEGWSLSHGFVLNVFNPFSRLSDYKENLSEKEFLFWLTEDSTGVYANVYERPKQDQVNIPSSLQLSRVMNRGNLADLIDRLNGADIKTCEQYPAGFILGQTDNTYYSALIQPKKEE